MLPPNAHPHVHNRQIDDFLTYGNCRRSELQLRKHFAGYAAMDEISFLSRQTEVQMENMMEDCVLLIAAAASRRRILALIRERIEASELQAFRLFALAELRWSSQRSENCD